MIVALSALLASILTFYSGFGLGTILMPVVAIFFPLPIAIATTALVHFLQNLVKAGMLWRSIVWSTAWRFGAVAIAAAVPGAWVLHELALLEPLLSYSLWGLQGEVTLLSFVVGLLLVSMATLELLPQRLLTMKNIWLGGALSGFFGGLSGNQGAFRAAFLINAELGPPSFIGTSAAIAAAVDVVRLAVYWLTFGALAGRLELPLLSVAAGSAIAGTLLGVFWLKRVTIGLIQKLVVALLYLLGLLIGAGLI